MNRFGFKMLAVFVFGSLLSQTRADDHPATFQAGTAFRDITPTESMPMWGYSARKDKQSEGVLDPLLAKAIVIEAGGERLAIVGLDLGRGPTAAMTAKIRDRVLKEAKVRYVLLSGSHTHHGPVLELTDEAGKGKGRFDAAVRYAAKLPDLIAESIIEAAQKLQPARIGVSGRDLEMNRNRHDHTKTASLDPRLIVVRLDNLDGKPIAILVNYPAHPVMTDGKVFKYSSDFPGFLRTKVEKELQTSCVFIQGASGDLSPTPPPASVGRGPKAYGELLGAKVVEVTNATQTSSPKRPGIQGRSETFHFGSRINFQSPILIAVYSREFFPELVANFADHFREGVKPELTTILLNGELPFVGTSGEFFCAHAVRLRQRAQSPNLVFCGCCNDHCLYFPTIEAAAQGGYGADSRVSPVEAGAGELMMDRALIRLFEFQGKIHEKTFK